MNKTILITGGAGYIGSHMLLYLKDRGFTPIAFDSLARGHRDAVGDTLLVQGDLRSQDDLDQLFENHKIDLVMHFAALTYVDESVRNPELYHENNVAGTLNLLAAMKKFNVDKFVFSSSCAVYGEPHEIPIPESHPKNPISPYGENKLEVEKALELSASDSHLKSIALRYFNASGADAKGRAGERHDPETHIIPLVLMEAMRIKNGGDPKDSKLKVFGQDFETKDGTAVRDYIHVEDLACAHLLAAERLFNEKVAGFEAYNLGNGAGFSVLDVISIARDVTNQPIAFTNHPRREGDPAKLIGNFEKAKKDLGWTPKYTNLEEIIQTAWDWMNRK
jgi:UDP-glucose-4-epimerase GalE